MNNNSPFKPKQIYINPDNLDTIEPKLPPLPAIAKSKNVNVIPPKQEQPQAAEIADIEEQIATNEAQNVLNQYVRSQEEEELKKQTINQLMNQLQKQVDVPKRLTIADIMNGSNFGERLNTLAQYSAQPEFQRNLGNLLGTRLFNPQTGRFESTGNRLGREQEARLQADQQRAMDELKLQGNMANGVYRAMNEVDAELMKDNREAQRLAQLGSQFDRNYNLRERELAQKAELDQLDREARQQQQDFLNDLRMQEFQLKKDQLDLERQKLLGGGNGINPNNKNDISNIKMTAADRKSLTENKSTLANIEAGLKLLDENPNAYSFIKGVMGADLANRIDPKGVKTRTQIDNITAVYRKWLTGAQMSDKERKAYERFLPAPTDNYKIVKAKLEGMKDAIARNNEALLSNYGINAELETPSIDVDKKADIAKKLKDAGYSEEEINEYLKSKGLI